MAHDHPFPHRRSLRGFSRYVRLRYFILASIVVFLFYSFPANPSSYLPLPTNHQHTIQASFPPEPAAARSIRLERQSKVKEAFQHAWKGYKEHAWMHDEVMPLSGGHKDGFAGWAATLVDSLDTLYILGMQDEFEEALGALAKVDFSTPNQKPAERVPVFEITIRYLGGLLGAWDISGHQHTILLEKAKQLGDLLYRAFNTASGIPVPYYNWRHDGSEKLLGEDRVIIAQIGSLSLEFIRLSQVTGDRKYADAIQVITSQLQDTQNSTTLPGMWPSQVDCAGLTLKFTSQAYTLGAYAGESVPSIIQVIFANSIFQTLFLNICLKRTFSPPPRSSILTCTVQPYQLLARTSSSGPPFPATQTFFSQALSTRSLILQSSKPKSSTWAALSAGWLH